MFFIFDSFEGYPGSVLVVHLVVGTNCFEGYPGSALVVYLVVGIVLRSHRELEDIDQDLF